MYLGDEVVDEIAINADEFTSQDPTSVDIGCVSLEGFVVTQDLTGASCGHRCYQQAIPHAELP